VGLLSDIDRSLGVQTLDRVSKQGSAVWPDMRTYHGEVVEHGSRTRDLIGSYRAHTWVNVAVKAIANCVADVPIIAVREGSAEKPRQKAVGLIAYKNAHPRLSYTQVRERYLKDIGGTVLESHWALDLIDHPLEEAQVTRHEMLQAVVTYLETAGDSYIEKIYADKGKKTIKGLWPRIDPRYMWVIPGTERLIDGYLYRQSVKPIVFAPDEIIHLAYFHPENPYYGLAPAEVVKNSLIADLRAVEWNRLFFENGAIPEIVLTSDQSLSNDDAEMARKRWMDRFRDRKQRGVAVMGRGMKVQEMTRSHKDMEFLELRKWTRDEVLACYGVPPIYAGVREEGNRSISEVERRIFWENTILPRLGKIEDALNFGLMSGERGVRLCFDISAIEALQEDVAAKALTGQTLVSQGWTLNEVREDYWHLEPGNGDGVNAIYAPPMATPAGYIQGYTPEEPEEPSAPTGPAEEPEEPTAGATGAGKSCDLMGTRDASLPGQLPGSGRKDVPLVEAAHFTAAADLKRLLDMIQEHLPKIAAAGGGRGADILIGLGIPVPDNWETVFNFQPAIERWIREHMADTVKEIGGVTTDRAAGVITQGMKEGKNWTEIARDLRAEFEGMSMTRSETIARTEGGKAVSYGQHFLYEKTDVAYHGWLCQFFNSRQAHKDAHEAYSEGIPLEENFVVSDKDEGWSETMTAPRQGSIAANNISCYCEEIPMVEKGKAFVGYEAANVKSYETWLKSVEDEGEGKRFKTALARYFLDEGERYAAHLLRVAGA
jgi:HK97 family phage portal protein